MLTTHEGQWRKSPNAHYQERQSKSNISGKPPADNEEIAMKGLYLYLHKSFSYVHCFN